jgi:hypothetical protein
LTTYFRTEHDSGLGEGYEFQAKTDQAASQHVRDGLREMLEEAGGGDLDYWLYRHNTDANLADYPPEPSDDPDCYTFDGSDYLIMGGRVFERIREGTVCVADPEAEEYAGYAA